MTPFASWSRNLSSGSAAHAGFTSQSEETDVRNHSSFVRRSLSAVVGTAMLLACAGVAPMVVTAPPAAAAPPADTPVGSITLHVQSARSVNPGAGFVHQGDSIAHYHWLINQDDTGDPGTLADQGISSCLPATASGGSSNPDYADSCPWPSVRNTSGFAPIVAQGDETTLGDGTALTNLPVGKYLISVTADNFKIDGKHFAVTAAGGTQKVV